MLGKNDTDFERLNALFIVFIVKKKLMFGDICLQLDISPRQGMFLFIQ